MAKHPIFILDDHTDTTTLLELILSDQGYAVVTCNEPQRALHILGNLEQPCILFMDHSLPGIKPAEFKKQAERINNPVHFVLMTGLNAKEKARELGIEHALQKPFEPHEMLELVNKLYAVCAAA
jgi:CheY-like chemotaxis protein